MSRASASPQDTARGFKPFAGAAAVHHPPWFTYSLASFAIVLGIAANAWQVFTSVIAFFVMFTQGAVYRHLTSGQGTASAAALVISMGLALSFQIGVLFLVFRVHHEYQEQKVRIGDNMQAVKTTALQMVGHHRLLLAWSLLSFAADTVGDFTFITLISNDFVLLLAYTLALYAVSTFILSASLERQWAANVALENWRAYRAYTRLMQLKAQAAAARQQEKAEGKQS
jgi:hypothetical protein